MPGFTIVWRSATVCTERAAVKKIREHLGLPAARPLGPASGQRALEFVDQARERGVRLFFIRPGKSVDNAYARRVSVEHRIRRRSNGRHASRNRQLGCG